VASRSNRQRKLERARAERRIARQAERARRKRQIQAGVGASIALVLIVLGVTWQLGGFDSKPAENNAQGSCTWTPKDPSANPDTIDTGSPPASGELRSGFETMTIKTNLGDIEALLDLSQVPCTAASFKYLGEKKYFEGSGCHRLNTTSKLVTCGDPKGTGAGGPSYQFADENVPASPLADPTASPSPSAPPTYYAKGTIVMVNTGANTNGGQFTIVYGDGSDLAKSYSVVGTVTKGLEIVEGVAKAGAVDAEGKPAAEGKPKTALTIQQLSVGPPPASTPLPTTP
jgi:peptidyl-prolyl cis-trans isomerase B (cyclophilin B)